jgi:hypothetical protein
MKKGITFDQHKALAGVLKEMRETLSHVSLEIQKSYPVSVTNLFIKTQGSIDKLRYKMEELLIEESITNDYKDTKNIY